LTGGGVGKLPVVGSIAMARRPDGRMVAAFLAKLVGWKATTLVVETNRAAATENFILTKRKASLQKRRNYVAAKRLIEVVFV
jgi:hypothetical protein